MTTPGSTIDIARDFSAFPAGRYLTDGKFPGEKFRALLVEALRAHPVVTVQLDGVLGFGSSFLEEAFGGLVRDCGFTSAQLHSQLRIESEADETLIAEIWGYIDEAKPR